MATYVRPIKPAYMPKKQSGVILLLTLIVLVAMTLATIALIRSVDTTNVVAGNIAFKQAATQVADEGTELAIQCLTGITTLTCPSGGFLAGTEVTYYEIAANGYYPTGMEELDPTGNSDDPNHALVDWEENGCNGLPTSRCLQPSPSVSTSAAGYSLRYIVNRLCPSAGMPNNCPSTIAITSGASMGAMDYTSKGGLTNETQTEYYRIITRITGPRNSVSYVEAIVHF
ncbi:MAG: hypothetical protein PHW66_04605 [Gallionella sp.]|nr:hypothetical protein [Gallionella sp.]